MSTEIIWNCFDKNIDRSGTFLCKFIPVALIPAAESNLPEDFSIKSLLKMCRHCQTEYSIVSANQIFLLCLREFAKTGKKYLMPMHFEQPVGTISLS